jgi:hypothetical protein
MNSNNMDTIRKNIALRQSANREIIEILSDMVERHPDLRFGQILAITEAIQYVPDSRSYIDTADVKDPFNEESVDMWIRMRDKMIELNKNTK